MFVCHMEGNTHIHVPVNHCLTYKPVFYVCLFIWAHMFFYYLKKLCEERSSVFLCLSDCSLQMNSWKQDLQVNDKNLFLQCF